MEHANATAARNLFATLAAGDIATVFDAFSDDIVLINDIGAGPWREARGKQALLEFWGQWMELFDGTFRQDVVHAIGYDDRVVLVIHETGTAQGEAFDNRAIYLSEIVDGKWTSVRTMDMDHDSINRFWSAVQPPELTGP
jgi:ketosteroid isomerase-like protein